MAIFLPKKLNVGFQKRAGTYSGKLAYIIYYDQNNKLRKETSWQNWRDKKIPNEEYDNEPLEGFVFNKKVGGVEESYYDARKTYVRVYDPRGFEFEITIPNLLWILQNCDCTKGKGLNGEFVYGWDGTELLLVPVDSPEYKEIAEKNKIIHNNEFVKPKDFKIGAVYKDINDCKYVYMGKYKKWNSLYNHWKRTSYWKTDEGKYDYPVDEGGWKKIINSAGEHPTFWKYAQDEKYSFFFIKLKNKLSEETYITTIRTANKKFILVSEFVDDYSEYVNMLNCCHEFSPIESEEIESLPYKNFEAKAMVVMSKGYSDSFIVGVVCEDGVVSRYIYYNKDSNTFDFRTRNSKEYKTIQDLYNDIKPVYITRRLQNGFECEGYLGKEYYYDENGNK